MKAIDADTVLVRTPDPAGTGRNISRMRRRLGMTNKDLQHAVRLKSASTVTGWQNGSRLPTIDHILLLSDLFSVEPEDIVVFQ